MTQEPSIADRLADVSQAMRAPLTRDFGTMTEEGRRAEAALNALINELPSIEAKSPADALALLSLGVGMMAVLLQNARGNPLAENAAGGLATVLLRLRAYLEPLSGREADEFALGKIQPALD